MREQAAEALFPQPAGGPEVETLSLSSGGLVSRPGKGARHLSPDNLANMIGPTRANIASHFASTSGERRNQGPLEAPEWEHLALVDPLLNRSDPAGWTRALNDHLNQSESEISRLMIRARSFRRPAGWNRCLDFGCGVGAFTRALAKHFHSACGIDISQNRIGQAKEINRDVSNCEFVCASDIDELLFPDNSFDLVLSRNTLHNLPSKALIEPFLGKLIRVLKPDGVLLFNMPVSMTRWRRLLRRRRVWRIMRALGVPRELLSRAGLHHMQSQVLSEDEVSGMLEPHGAGVCTADHYPSSNRGVSMKMFYVVKK